MTSKSETTFSPWEAFISRTESIPLEQAKGRIAATTIRQYPPGIPDVIPGMKYDDGAIMKLRSAIAADVNLIGINPESERAVDVVCTPIETGNKFDIQTLPSCDIPNHIGDEIADYFRVSFSGAPYFHFACHESDPLQPLPRGLDYAAYAVALGLSNTEVRSECQNTLIDLAIRSNIDSTELSSETPVTLPKGFHLWTDKDVCRARIKDRLSDPGYVTLVRDRVSNQIKGLLHARMGTVARLFYTEEWSNPHIFSTFEDKNFRDESGVFFEKINYHFGLVQSDPVMTISAQVLDPDIQGGEAFYDMMKSLAQNVSPKHAQLPVLSEIPAFGTAHILNTAMNERIVHGVLKNGHPLVFCRQFAGGLFPLIGAKKHWQHLLRMAARSARDYRKKYFIPLSTDNPNVIVRPNGKLGLAVYATSDISAGETIAVFTGETYKSDTALGLPDIMRDHAIQIGKDEFVFGYKGLAHRVCHSCNPNCGIRGRTEIFSVRNISKGEQITWDYRCSENSDWVLETCLCGSERCTGFVGNYQSLPASFKAEYKSKNMISDWLNAL